MEHGEKINRVYYYQSLKWRKKATVTVRWYKHWPK